MAIKDLVPRIGRGGERMPVRRGEYDFFRDFQREMNRLFDDFFTDFPLATRRGERDLAPAAFSPRVDVSETDKEVKISAELPGMDEKDITLEMDDASITVLGEWDPFKEMQSMHDRIDQMFGSAYNRFRRSDDFGSLFGNFSFSPAINVEDKRDRYVVTVDVPGAEDSRLDVKLDGQTLTISGTVHSETKDEEKGRMLRQERRSGRFQRTVTLPSPVQSDKMTTKTEKGILSIEIPKASDHE